MGIDPVLSNPRGRMLAREPASCLWLVWRGWEGGVHGYITVHTGGPGRAGKGRGEDREVGCLGLRGEGG